MPDIVTSKTFVDGEKGITATKMNQIIGGAVIQPSFVSSKPASPTLDPTDQILELKGSGAYATITGQQLIDSVAASVAHIPPGVIWDFAGLSIPTGWLFCDGSAQSRTTYANLYAALGGINSPWGQGDGSTTFNLPDLRGRVGVCTGQGTGLTSRALADVGGEEAHLLSTAEAPYHYHGMDHYHNIAAGQFSHSHTDSGHQHGYNVLGAGSPFNAPGGAYGVSGSNTGVGYANIAANTLPAGSTASAAATNASYANTGPAGGGTSHNTMPPFAVVNKIIKT